MKTEIRCKETIQPSSPTPDHLRTHNLTILDQLAVNLHVPLLLFYSKPSDSTQTFHHLKKSLQQTLTLFYPLAGRVIENSYIECNDAGATYVETSVDCNLNEVLQEPSYEKVRQLLPINPNENLIQFSVSELLLIQVNHFRCGGVAIGVCISHVVADASTLATLVKSWAAIARGDEVETDGVIINYSSIFPPIDLRTLGFSSLNDLVSKDDLLKGCVTNRFVFEGPKIAALRDKIGSMTPCSDLPTRFEALSSLILGVLMSITEGKSNDLAANITVDIRKRTSPPFPHQSFGNIWLLTQLNSLSNEKEIDYNDLARKIRNSVRWINDENVRLLGGGQMLEALKMASQNMGKGMAGTGVASFSSWCKFPYYEADFGWGKPTWVATVRGHNRVANFLDSKDGEGIEVWLGLPKDLMSQFEQNPDVVEYSSFIASK